MLIEGNIDASSVSELSGVIPEENLETPEPNGSSEEEPSNEETPETPETPEVAETPEPVKDLYELPDGRKVDAETLTKEWKENFLPDYTRKSQELSKLTKSNEPKPQERGADWVPESYAEIVQVAKEEAIRQIVSEQQQKTEQQQEAELLITSQLEEIKKESPTIDEAKLFQHANKYQFSDLKLAYQNMKEMNMVAKNTEKIVQKNIAARKDESVAGKPSGKPAESGIEWSGVQSRGGLSALEYLQSLEK